MANNYETIDERLENENLKDKKRGLVRITALVLAAFVTVSSGIAGITHIFKNKNKDAINITNKPTIQTTKTTTTKLSTVDLNSLGVKMQTPTKPTQEIVVVKGNINTESIVEKNDKLYDSKKSADNSNQTGSKKIDTKNGTLIVKPNGEVFTKKTGYEIKDNKGNTIATGDLSNGSDIPDGYERNKAGIFEKEDNTANLVRCDANYYGYDSNNGGKYGLIFKKGELVTKDTLENIKKNFSTNPTAVKNDVVTTTKSTVTTKPTVQTTQKTTVPTKATTPTLNTFKNGVVNTDGTFTIALPVENSNELYTITFESKADYQAWLLGEEYHMINGVMKPMEEIQKQLQKTR